MWVRITEQTAALRCTPEAVRRCLDKTGCSDGSSVWHSINMNGVTYGKLTLIIKSFSNTMFYFVIAELTSTIEDLGFLRLMGI